MSWIGIWKNRFGSTVEIWLVAADRSISATREGAPAKAAELNRWRAMAVNADTFERIG
jgi:hypothetical protein